MQSTVSYQTPEHLTLVNRHMRFIKHAAQCINTVLKYYQLSG